MTAAAPASVPVGPKQTLSVQRGPQGIWSHVRKRWLVETPEERVRQEYLCTLVNEYGYDLEQIAEEVSVTGRGSAAARADFLIWRSVQEKVDGKPAFIVVECKADNVTIDQSTYEQGAHYAQYERASFFVTHNNRETKFWKVDLEKRAPNFSEIENIPTAGATDRQIKDLLAKLRVFRETEFAETLHKCHNIIRNQHHLDPAAAFDEIAKVLFVKVRQERQLREQRVGRNLFTANYLEQQHREAGVNMMDVLFEHVRREYAADRLFAPDEKINLSFETCVQIVRLLEAYNLSDTSEDIKGVAFERFLGRTFRGEIGQFFTPRPIVEFMIRMVEPKEGEVICDPASGSGGFLIRFFEIVREQILADLDAEYRAFVAETEARADLSDEARAALLRAKYDALNAERDKRREGSRLWKLANRCIYGTDANERMARTSKMNMIMHGDGHGGIHHRNGFLNVNGIFEGRFDIILTNPPFGANVEATHKVRDEDVEPNPDAERRYLEEFGDLYRQAQGRIRAAKGEPIATLFELPKVEERRDGEKKVGRIKTEILFIERCLSLLKPGGRLGVVLPEGIFNNPSLAYVREFCEDRAFLLAVVSLPQETFTSSGASVKTSLLFLRKFTEEEKARYEETAAAAREERAEAHRPEREAKREGFRERIAAARLAGKRDEAAAVAREEREYEKAMEERIRVEARALLKERFDYPVFLYEAEKVGITATAEEDANELYPNPRVPASVGAGNTALEVYGAFRANPEAFYLEALSAPADEDATAPSIEAEGDEE